METRIHSEYHAIAGSLYISVAFVSSSVLMLEIGLTRIFSVMFDSHYVFLVLSLAILGLGTGGIYVHTTIKNMSNQYIRLLPRLFRISSGLMALSVLAMTIAIINIPLFHRIYIVAFLAFIPFFFGGIFLASAFRFFPEKSANIYAADLIGASIGSLLVVVLLKLGGINVIILVAAIASIPGCLLIFIESDVRFKWRWAPLFTAGIITLFVFNHTTAFLGAIPLARSAHKEMSHLLAHPSVMAKVIDTRWSAFGRTDLLSGTEELREKIFFIDGTAGSSMYQFDKDLASLDRPEFKGFPGYFPFELLSEKEKEKVLVIGAGGGREVLISLLAGAKDITAVEVNADLVDLMNKYSNYNGGLYNGFPGVKVVVGEGRHFIRADKQKYDIIMLSIPVTKTSRSPEGYVLTENFLFTVESINDYLDHLKAHGRLIVVAHHEMEIYRLVFTSLSALNKRGIQPASAMKHIYTLGDEVFPVFVLKKSPLTLQEAERVHEQMHERGFTTLSSFIPFIEQEMHLISLGEGIYQQHPMLNQVLYMMSKGEVSAEDLIKMTDFNLKAVSDNDPFFYKFNIGLPALLSFLLIFSTIAMIGGWVIKPGYMKEDISRKSSICLLLFFSALGIGFMMIEIPLIQKFTLFLGQPVYSLTILLFSVLIGAGMGSWFSGQMGRIRTLLKLRLAVMMVSAITIIYVIFLNPFFQLLLGSPFYIRALASFILLMPLGFFLGMPFPLGMKLLAELDLEHLVPRMWGVNGIGSVLGSALSIALAISFGFSYALILGIALYSFIYILFSKQILVLPPEVRG